MTKFKSGRFSSVAVRCFSASCMLAVFMISGSATAAIEGISGTSFSLTAKEGYITVADGGSIYSWGYADNGTGAAMQLPGPTLIVTQGQSITVTLTNDLPVAAGNVSIVFPGQTMTGITGGVDGALTKEAPTGGSVAYTFTPTEPGTYQYHSGTDTDLQVEMGLFGAIIVRPNTTVNTSACTAAAYDHADACYDREYLYVLSEIDYEVHTAAELQSGGPGPIVPPIRSFSASEYWLMNGRAGPDSMAATTVPGTGIQPHQPYGSLTRMHPGEKVLIRLVGAGRESHPFHHHGNHSRVLANDGRMLLTNGGNLAGPLLFTLPSTPGGTTDAIFEWTGKDLGWDIYGTDTYAEHPAVCVDTVNNETGLAGSDGYADPLQPNAWEWCADHMKPIPVTLPSLSSLAFGGFWGGSPYLGDAGSLPPGEGGLNPGAGFTFMWHSHTERELVNNDVFPGGMMTMLIVEAPWVSIP